MIFLLPIVVPPISERAILLSTDEINPVHFSLVLLYIGDIFLRGTRCFLANKRASFYVALVFYIEAVEIQLKDVRIGRNILSIGGEAVLFRKSPVYDNSTLFLGLLAIFVRLVPPNWFFSSI